MALFQPLLRDRIARSVAMFIHEFSQTKDISRIGMDSNRLPYIICCGESRQNVLPAVMEELGFDVPQKPEMRNNSTQIAEYQPYEKSVFDV